MPKLTDDHVGFFALQSKQTCRCQCFSTVLWVSHVVEEKGCEHYRLYLVVSIGLKLLKDFLNLFLGRIWHGRCVLVKTAGRLGLDVGSKFLVGLTQFKCRQPKKVIATLFHLHCVAFRSAKLDGTTVWYSSSTTLIIQRINGANGATDQLLQ